MATIVPSGTEVRSFDFRRPPWISRERRAVLDGAHERMLPAMERHLTAALGGSVTLTIRDVAQLAFGDWRREVTSPVTAYVIPLAPGEGGDGILWVATPLAQQLVDRLLGGSGDIGERSAPLTPLEQRVFGAVLTPAVALLQQGYREVAPFTPGPLRYEAVAESLAVVPRHERVLLVDATLEVESVTGSLSWLLPASRIDGFLRGTPGAAPPPPPSEEQTRAALERELRAATVPVSVRLTGLRLTAREGATLRVGQVLASNQTFRGDVELHVNGRPRFLGALGRHQGHVGLRILERLDGSAIPSRLLRRTSG